MVVCQAHGILTEESSPSWPDFGSAWFAAFAPGTLTVNTEYFELPLPRLAALRNPGRARRLVRRVKTLATYGVEMRPERAEIAFVSHSNGAVLAMQAVRALIAEGIAVKSLILIAPALRTREATREIREWIDRGMLGQAVLVRPLRDKLIGTIGRSWRTKLAAWPWGSLGWDGWHLDEMGSLLTIDLLTIDLPDMGHTDPVAPHNRRWLYESIIGPALGIAPWGELNAGGPEA